MRADSDCLVTCRIRRVRLGFVAGAAATLIMLTTLIRSTQAGYILTLDQVGPNVVATGTGAFDLSGLIFNGTGGSQVYVNPSFGAIFLGPEPFEPADDYTGFTGPTSFGGGGGMLASSGSGNRVGIIANAGLLFVPQNYVSNTPLFSSSTWNNVTLGSLGVTPGMYVWSWGTGSNQDFTLEVGAVPEPGTLFLLVVAVLMLIVVKLRRLSLMRMFRQVSGPRF